MELTTYNIFDNVFDNIFISFLSLWQLVSQITSFNGIMDKQEVTNQISWPMTQGPLCMKYGCGLVAKLWMTLVTPWTIARQAPLSLEFSRQEYWSGLPFPSPGDLWLHTLSTLITHKTPMIGTKNFGSLINEKTRGPPKKRYVSSLNCVIKKTKQNWNTSVLSSKCKQ